jgi:hypothetical protein
MSIYFFVEVILDLCYSLLFYLLKIIIICTVKLSVQYAVFVPDQLL